MPRFSEDDYIDFCVAEAVVARGDEMDRAAEDQAKRDAWKSEIKNNPPPGG